jgi:hypothetical protein
MEKLKSWNALSNFATAPAATAGFFCFEDRMDAGLDQEHPSGAEAPRSFGCAGGPAKAVPLLQDSLSFFETCEAGI